MLLQVSHVDFYLGLDGADLLQHLLVKPHKALIEIIVLCGVEVLVLRDLIPNVSDQTIEVELERVS